MKIVVLDGFTMNPGDLTWDELKKYGDLTVYERTEESLIKERCEDAEIVFTNKVVLDSKIIPQLSKLKFIGVLATGFNVVDIETAKEYGIVVSNVPAYSTASVAQLTFALLLELTMHVEVHNKSVRKGEWESSKDFSYTKSSLIELAGLTFGIIGFGRIGRAVAKIANAFGMKVVINNRSKVENLPEYVTQVGLNKLVKLSDVVSLHIPLTDENKGFVNDGFLSLMKHNSFLINTSRGGLINEYDLSEALNTNKIAGAGLDVLSTEPPLKDNYLLKAKNCIITPHIAWATTAARKRLMEISVENVRAFINGRPQNVVN